MSFKIESTEGAIEGEYIEREGEIEVWEWSWGVTHAGTTHHGRGGGQGELRVQDLSFTKPIDKSTPALMRMLIKGISFTEAVLTVRKASGGDESFDYFKVTLAEGVVSSVTARASLGQEQMTEIVTLNFPKFKIEYVSQEAANTPGASVPMGWDIPGKKDF
jgi:type VI secretion system secreted protein Hcp